MMAEKTWIEAILITPEHEVFFEAGMGPQGEATRTPYTVETRHPIDGIPIPERFQGLGHYFANISQVITGEGSKVDIAWDITKDGDGRVTDVVQNVTRTKKTLAERRTETAAAVDAAMANDRTVATLFRAMKKIEIPQIEKINEIIAAASGAVGAIAPLAVPDDAAILAIIKESRAEVEPE